MTDDRDERRIQAVADALRGAIERGTRPEILGPFAEAIIGAEPVAADEPAGERELVGAGLADEHFFG